MNTHRSVKIAPHVTSLTAATIHVSSAYGRRGSVSNATTKPAIPQRRSGCRAAWPIGGCSDVHVCPAMSISTGPTILQALPSHADDRTGTGVRWPLHTSHSHFALGRQVSSPSWSSGAGHLRCEEIGPIPQWKETLPFRVEGEVEAGLQTLSGNTGSPTLFSIGISPGSLPSRTCGFTQKTHWGPDFSSSVAGI